MAVNSDGAQAPVEGAKGAHLGRRSLGVADIVFFVVAASAPLTVVAGGVPTSFAVTNLLGIPLVYVIIAVILLVFAVGYAAMSRHGLMVRRSTSLGYATRPRPSRTPQRNGYVGWSVDS